MDQFFLPSGVRIAALLACPIRMWPYLMLGEYAYFAQLRIPMIETYTLEWALMASAFQFPLAAVLVHLHREDIRSGDPGWILPLSVLAAGSISFLNVAMAYLLWPEPPLEDFASLAIRYSLGDFLGIVTLAPLAMLWMTPARAMPLKNGRGLLTAGLAAVLVLLLAAALYTRSRYLGGVPIQLLMAVPVIGMTFALGWRGAALGVPALNIAVHLCTDTTGLPGSFDPSTFDNQVYLAVIAAALLLSGTALGERGIRPGRKA